MGILWRTGKPVSQLVADRMPVTVELTLLSAGLTLVLSSLAGVISALYCGRLVDNLARLRSPALLGAAAARHRGEDRAWGPRWDAGACAFCQREAAAPARGGAAAGSRPDMWGGQNRGGVPGAPQAAPGLVDVGSSRRGGAHTQGGGASPSARRALAQRQLWHAARGGLPVCRS